MSKNPQSLTEGITSMKDLSIVIAPIDNRDEDAKNLAAKINEAMSGKRAAAFWGPLTVITGAANSFKIPYVVYMGGNESEKGVVTVRNMNERRQYEISVDQIENYLLGLIRK